MSNFISIPKPTSFAAVNATKRSLKAVPGNIHGWQIFNTTGAEAFMQVFDKLAADVTVGTTIADYVVPLPASGGAVLPASNVGFRHDIGLVIACTTTPTGAVDAACDGAIFWR